MKNKISLISLFLLLIPYSFSQCKDYVIDSCYYTANSQADSNIFMSNFIPNNTTPIVYIKINFHIGRKDDGTGNLWLDTPEYRDTLQQVVDWLNVFFSNNHLPSDTIHDAQFISDIKVRFVIDTFYYYNNSFIAYCYNETSFQNYLIAEYPERLNNFSYHLGLDVTQGYSGRSNGVRATYPTILTIKQISGNTINTFGFAIHMAHEFGHNFGLDHTYDYSKSLILSHPEFLWDIFGHNVQAWCSSPPDEQSVCWHDAGWDCNPYDSTNTCTNFLMGGTKYTKSISALQAGRIHRALSIAPLRKCTYGYHTTPYVISQNTTWDYTRKMYQNIVIDSGVTFTVLCTLEFVSQASIYVHPGGKLIIDGGTLTNACNGELWQGIFVEGNPFDSSQYENLQGYIELKNGATIENAVCAINVGLQRPDESPTWLVDQGGGIVKASNASFINNLKAVEFGPYSRHHVVKNVHAWRNVSGFTQCNFTINTNALFDLDEFEQHVNLYDVEGVHFGSCSFSSVNNKGTAIQSLSSAGFVLNDNFSFMGSERNNVAGFDVGIRILDGNATDIHYTDFNDNNTAILVEGGYNISIYRNNFQIPYESDYGPTTGVTLTNCPLFSITNNLFHGVYNCDYGLIINHSGANDNIVKNNEFSNLNIAALAYGKNSDGEDGYKGLQYHCNRFENNNYDIMVADFVTNYVTEPGSIRFNQGDKNKACGNIFTVNGNSLTSPNYSFQYHFKSNSPEQIPINISGNIRTVAEYNYQCNQIGIQNPNIVPVNPPVDWNDELVNNYNMVANSLV
ncbi:MAG TPA: hypothetical protein PKX15_05670, partial [Bacteroidales bacterium]|nr:hypothetical protein [Bacteroidales bacterium]